MTVLKMDVSRLEGTRMMPCGSIFWTGETFIMDPPGSKGLLLALAVPVWNVNRDREPVTWMKQLSNVLNNSSRYSASEVHEVPDDQLPWNFTEGQVPEDRPGSTRFREVDGGG